MVFDVVLIYLLFYLELLTYSNINRCGFIFEVNKDISNFFFLQNTLEIIKDWLHILFNTLIILINLFKTYIFELNF
jgi:hypothetical protein